MQMIVPIMIKIPENNSFLIDKFSFKNMNAKIWLKIKVKHDVYAIRIMDPYIRESPL